MNQSKRFLTALFVLTLTLAASLVSYSQPESNQFEPNYDVSLQLLVGSNDTGARAELPANLSNVSRQLKGTFPFSNYRLVSTLMGRISNAGSFEYKSITNIFDKESILSSQTFLDWSVRELRNVPTAGGAPGFSGQSFRFGARVPIGTGSYKDEAGKSNPIVHYEQVGITLGKVGLSANTPTLIGTLDLPGDNGTIFLIMTVKPSDI